MTSIKVDRNHTLSYNGSSIATKREEAAASYLVGMKHQQLSQEECRVTSELCYSIMFETDDSLKESQSCNADDDVSTIWVDSTKRPSSIQGNGITKIFQMPIALAAPRDTQFLSPLQCYIRLHCTEYFVATINENSNSPSSTEGENYQSRSRRRSKSNSFHKPGRRTPVSGGRIGIRCVFCKHSPPNERASQANSFPSKIHGIYSSVVMMQCRHFPHCRKMPTETRDKIASLKKAGASTGTTTSTSVSRQHYWRESAKEMGFVDTEGGIRFEPSSFNESLDINRKYDSSVKNETDDRIPSTNKDDINIARDVMTSLSELTTPEEPHRPKLVSPAESFQNFSMIQYDLLIQGSPLVSVQDKDLVPGHVFLAIAQMQPCQLAEADRVGCYKSRPIGFTGMCCRYCQGHSHSGPGFGKFFPNSVRSLAQTTTTQTIVKHIAFKCHRCPKNIRNAVSALLRDANANNSNANGKQLANAPLGVPSDDTRPKYGSRKEFFQRVWDRLHGHPQGHSKLHEEDRTTFAEISTEGVISDEHGDGSVVVTIASSGKDDSTTTVMMVPSSLKKKMFLPIVRQVVSVSSASDAGSDESLRADEDYSLEEDIVVSSLNDVGFSVKEQGYVSPTEFLVDDKNRRVFIRGENLSMFCIKKRKYDSSISDTSRKRTKEEMF